MSNEKVCGLATIRREVCKVLKPENCFDDRQEKELCAAPADLKKELDKLCAGYFTGIGPGNLHHKKAWLCLWNPR